MARNPVKRAEIVIDPAFNIPEGVDELVYADVFLESPEDGTSEDIPDDDDTPDVPDTFTIISQTLVEGTGGAQFVDIVAEVEDVVGVVRYEYRLTKETV